jgi:hypothetical protein
MKQRFNKKKYGQRWQTETVNSMIKRRLGSALRARSYWSQCREIMLRVITHNVMIVARIWVFYRAFLTPFWLRKGFLQSSFDPFSASGFFSGHGTCEREHLGLWGVRTYVQPGAT